MVVAMEVQGQPFKNGLLIIILNVTIRSFGIPDEFIEHASRDEMIRMASLMGMRYLIRLKII